MSSSAPRTVKKILTTSDQYREWSKLMIAELGSEGCEGIIKGTEKKPLPPPTHIPILKDGVETMASATERRFLIGRTDVFEKQLLKYEQRVFKAKKLLMERVAENLRHYVVDVEPDIGWKRLETNCLIHEEDDRDQYDTRFNEFGTIKPDQSMEQHVNALLLIVSRLKELKVPKNDSDVIKKLNGDLPNSYSAFKREWEKKRKKKKFIG